MRGRKLRLFFCAGVDDDYAIPRQLKWLEFGQGIGGAAAQERHPQHSGDLQHSDDPSLATLRTIGVQAFSCYPLLSDGKLVGALAFGTRRAPAFDPDEQELHYAVAHQLAVALDRMLLIHELARNNRKLSTANAGLRHANAELEQFAFLASHDLREPIRHLNIYTEILRRKLDSQLDQDARQYLRFVLLSAGKLEMLIADLLAYTKVIREKPPETEVHANAVLATVLETLQPLIRKTAAVVRVTDLPLLRMNEGHLAELFQQIIENALKFRRPGASPEVDIFCYRRANGTIVCVRDNGVGIETEHQGRIFGLFKRLESSGNQDTGIGLAICQRIVERYHGQIWVESEIGKGSLFCFRLGKQTNVLRPKSATA